ncbi:MAG: MFS transporter [Paraburkholderia sp.]|uniref:MFS transporter n=1 Tax=Paraburkholderia sp. TaxID=1926495 RepID=UPI0012233250|nr:MFS transporter [Paraburkholderia sp.]TAL97779.1 MAG: MFS transporter [Paraburkholderia sp.]
MPGILPLCLGTFALGIDAYIMAGLLPGIAAGFQVPASVVGQTVTIFTACYAITAPLFGALTAGKPVRWVLGAALVLFTLANVLSAIATSFTVLLISRAAAGVDAGLFSPTAFSAAASMVSPARRGRALGLVVGGLALGTAVGVPSGLVLAERSGWRSALWLIVVLGGFALAGVVLGMPEIAATPPPSFRQRIAVLVDARVAMTIAVSFATSAASIGLYTFVAPLLHTAAGVTNALPYLWMWSLGGLAGVYFCGVLIDATGSPEWIMSLVLLLMLAVFASLAGALPHRASAFALFGIWGIAAWSSQAPQQHRLLSLHPDKGSIVVALQSSAHYLGSAAGTALGGLALASGFSLTQLPLLSTGLIALALSAQLGVATWARSDAVRARRSIVPIKRDLS